MSSGKKDRLAEYAVEIAELQERLDLNLKKCFYELHRLNRYINSIDDSQIRMILSFRYINGLRWRQIAFKLGRKATEDNVRITHDRFLKNNM